MADETIPVYIDDLPGSVYVEAFPFPNGLHILDPGEVCHVPASTVAAWDAARQAWDAAQREMRQCLEQRRKKAKAEILVYGRPEDEARLERYEKAKADRRAQTARWVKESARG